MKFRFIGDPERGGDGPEVSYHYGYRFMKGLPVTVDAETAEKLATNSHFERADAVVTERAVESMSKDELELYARNRYGLELDKRYSRQRLIRQIYGHQNGHPEQSA